MKKLSILKKRYKSTPLNIAFAVTGMVLLSGCSGENSMQVETESNKTFTICAVMPDAPASKAYYGDDTGDVGSITDVYWSDDLTDSLTFHQPTSTNTTETYYAYKDKTTNKAKNATFYARVECGSEVILYSVYPGTDTKNQNKTRTYGRKNISFDLSSQSGTKEDVAKKYDLMVCCDTVSSFMYSNQFLYFKHKVAIVKLTINNDDFKNQNVTSVGITATGLINKGLYTFTTDAWSTDDGSEEKVISTGTEVGDATTGAVTVYLAIIPTALTNVTVTASCNSKTYTISLKDLTPQVGNLYRVNVTPSMTM